MPSDTFEQVLPEVTHWLYSKMPEVGLDAQNERVLEVCDRAIASFSNWEPADEDTNNDLPFMALNTPAGQLADFLICAHDRNNQVFNFETMIAPRLKSPI